MFDFEGNARTMGWGWRGKIFFLTFEIERKKKKIGGRRGVKGSEMEKTKTEFVVWGKRCFGFFLFLFPPTTTTLSPPPYVKPIGNPLRLLILSSTKTFYEDGNDDDDDKDKEEKKREKKKKES